MSYDLYLDDGKHYRSVRVGIRNDQLRVDTHDMGPNTEAFWGDSDYEFWITVDREHWGDLAVALIRRFLADERNATSHLESICSKYGVTHETGRWI